MKLEILQYLKWILEMFFKKKEPNITNHVDHIEKIEFQFDKIEINIPITLSLQPMPDAKDEKSESTLTTNT
jgi:hypothetical protein